MEFQKLIFRERGSIEKDGADAVLLVIIVILLGVSRLRLPLSQNVLLSVQEGSAISTLYTPSANAESFEVGDSVRVLFSSGRSGSYRITAISLRQGRRQVQVQLGQAGEREELLDTKVFLREEHLLKSIWDNYSY